MNKRVKLFTLMILTAAFTVSSCGKDRRRRDQQYNYNYGGPCGAPVAGADIIYAETGIGTAWRNNVPASLELTIVVDRSGRTMASGRLHVQNSEAFFSEGFGNGSNYFNVPVRGPIDVCVSSQTGAGAWDDFLNETSSDIRLVGGNIEIVLGPGAYVSSNGLFVPHAFVGIAGYNSGGEVTFTPGSY